jgi:hypothetical protein
MGDGVGTRWRTDGSFSAKNASKTGLFEETRQYLVVYGLTGTLTSTREMLVNGALPQRSRASRETIVQIITTRLITWQPPAWVLRDLVLFAGDPDQTSLCAALLLHSVRQDTLMYDLVQDVVVPRWRDGEHLITRGDVQRYLDKKETDHPEVTRWSLETREKLAGNILSILRDYGLLSGKQKKYIVEPVVPHSVVAHLIRLLEEEGVPVSEIPTHPDWRIWLMDEGRVKQAISDLSIQGGAA